ncbi:MAG: hypothetical protein F4018_15240 [Acidobacteria bacterium]|nr:hypothetical protein [Acidobacteriota bacterium]MYH27716.1 hypothetical protein [Acidobacteriota bacterium]MYK89577.1 hypothetical protein [Acidobacteriota bacterium]
MDTTAIAIVLVAAAATTELWFMRLERAPHRRGKSRAASTFPVVAFPLTTALLAQGAEGAIGPLATGPLTMAGWLLTAAAWPAAIIIAWITQND